MIFLSVLITFTIMLNARSICRVGHIKFVASLFEQFVYNVIRYTVMEHTQYSTLIGASDALFVRLYMRKYDILSGIIIDRITSEVWNENGIADSTVS